MKIERFEDIEAWQSARQLTRNVYCLTKNAEFAKDFGLKRQIQDAAGSSMHNIAEGFDSDLSFRPTGEIFVFKFLLRSKSVSRERTQGSQRELKLKYMV